MRATAMWLALAAAAASGCASEDDWLVRPPGGGGGGGGDGGNGGGGDAGNEVSGRLCVIDDLRAPDACPATADAAGVRVRVRGGATVTTGDGGAFTLPAPAAAQLVDVADGAAALVPATARIVPGEAPALRAAHAAAWRDVLAAIAVNDLGGLGGVVVYVDDAAGHPLAGVTLDGVGGQWPPFYDDGAATRWRTVGGTGVAGVALLVGVPAGDAIAIDGTAPGARRITLAVPVRADALTFVRATVP